MRRIINLILEFKNLFFYLLLLFFTILFSYNNSNYNKSKIDELGLSIAGIIYKPLFFFNSYINLKNNNSNLIKENKRLQSLVYNQKLKNEYNYEETFSKFEIRNASIIKNSFNKTRNLLIINKGEINGIKKDMSVISSDGIVGIINQTSKNFSSVISILSRDIKINAKLKDSNIFGTLEWLDFDFYSINLSDISVSNKINIGDTIITGGMSYYFPENIIIGTIKSYKKSKSDGFYEIKVNLISNMSDISNVYILENKNRDEIIDLENLSN